MSATGCVGGYATSTTSRGRVTNAFRKRLFTLCMVWFNYHTVPRAFRGPKRESFPRAGCGKTASPGSMSGNRKQDQAKPDCGDEAKAESNIHRETTVTAPVLDSTPNLSSTGSDLELCRSKLWNVGAAGLFCQRILAKRESTCPRSAANILKLAAAAFTFQFGAVP